jgi:diaminopimelate epimerase
MATASLRVRLGQWYPVLEGNATFVYRATVDPAALARGLPAGGERELYPDEIRAYSVLDEQNAKRLRAVGIQSAAIETGAVDTADAKTS